MKYLFLIWIWLCGYPGVAQQNREELRELISVLQRPREDSVTVGRLIRVSELYYMLDSADRAILYCDKAGDLSRKMNYPFGVYLSLSQKGVVHEALVKDYPAAIGYYKQAIDTLNVFKLQEKIEDFDEHAYGKLLNLYFYLGDFTPAMRIASERLRFFERTGNKAKQAHYNSLIGFICLRQGKGGESKKYYERYLQYAKTSGDSLQLADAYNCLADVHLFNKDIQAAFQYLFSSLAIYKAKDKKERIAYTLYKIAGTYEQKKDHKNALSNVLQAIDLTFVIPCNKYDVAAFYILAGNVYKELNDQGNALKYLSQGLATAEEIHHAEDIRDACHSLMQVFALMKRYDSAYHYSQRYEQFKDSITNEKSRREIERIHTAYEVDNKNQEIALLNQQNMRQKLMRNGIIVLGVFFAAVFILLYNRRSLQQQNKFQAEMNRQRNELFNAVVTVQDKERKRIAQDIHDSLGSILSAAKLKLSEMGDNMAEMGDREKEKYHITLALLDEAAGELRNISHNIMPATLAKVGLVPALQSLAESISHTGLEVQLNAYGLKERLPEETEISAYRIVLELVNNAVKHAGADEITLQIISHSSYINITIEDNGKGFDYEKAVRQARGIGLGNIRSRVDYLGGTVSVESSEGAGTLVSVNIPFENKHVS